MSYDHFHGGNFLFFPLEPSLCEHEKEILLLNDYESITRWERQTLAIVRRYANEQRQRLTAPWPVLTIN